MTFSTSPRLGFLLGSHELGLFLGGVRFGLRTVSKAAIADDGSMFDRLKHEAPGGSGLGFAHLAHVDETPRAVLCHHQRGAHIVVRVDGPIAVACDAHLREGNRVVEALLYAIEPVGVDAHAAVCGVPHLREEAPAVIHEGTEGTAATAAISPEEHLVENWSVAGGACTAF